MTNTEIIQSLQEEMQLFDKGSPERIQHFTKVHSFASQIGRLEKLDETTLFTLEMVAILHDIGIKPSEDKYGFSNGKTQEEMGPPFARTLLEKHQVPEEQIERICYLIAHHHTYDDVNGMDYRILLEADFLVNLYENSVDKEGINTAFHRIFKTNSGRRLCKIMYDF